MSNGLGYGIDYLIEDYQGIVDKNLRNKLIAKRRRRNYTNHIRSGKCFECSGKLVRGNRDKDDNYKRSWKCKDCGSTYKI